LALNVQVDADLNGIAGLTGQDCGKSECGVEESGEADNGER